ncbi:MAG: hypothetical protein QOF01_4221 [Thermomicrobiales bacterium]|nr:hypothetical protein [Thermomicrobiales bacterium]
MRGDCIEDSSTLFGGAAGGLAAVAVGNDAVEGTEDADDVVHPLVREIDSAVGVGQFRAKVEHNRHLGLATVVEVDVEGPGEELARETLPASEEGDGHAVTVAQLAGGVLDRGGVAVMGGEEEQARDAVRQQ